MYSEEVTLRAIHGRPDKEWRWAEDGEIGINCEPEKRKNLSVNHIWGKGYQDVLNVPLFVKYPGEMKGTETEAKVMLTDIMASCMKTAGVREPVQTDGRDFKGTIEEGGYPYVFSEGEGFVSISAGSFKYIHINKNGSDKGPARIRKCD